MTEYNFTIALAPEVRFFSVHFVPELTSNAIYPPTDGNDDKPIARAACRMNHEEALASAIAQGLVTPLNPLSFNAEPLRTGHALKHAVLTRAEVARFAATLGIEITDALEPDERAVVEPNKYGYTIEGAAKAIAEKYDVPERKLRDSIFEAAARGELTVRDPQTGLPSTSKVRRDFYGQISITDLNAWLERQGVDYRLDCVPERRDAEQTVKWDEDRKRKLREEHAQLVRAKHKFPTKELAEKYGVSATRIRELKRED